MPAQTFVRVFLVGKVIETHLKYEAITLFYLSKILFTPIQHYFYSPSEIIYLQLKTARHKMRFSDFHSITDIIDFGLKRPDGAEGLDGTVPSQKLDWIDGLL